jgi:branched-chain amino acid transport system permease protein
MGQQAVNAIVLGSSYLLFTLGLSLSWGVLGVLNLAHGAIFMIGAIVAYQVTKGSDASLVVVLPVAAAAGGACAVILELVAYRPIRNRLRHSDEGDLRALIASVAAASILVAIGDEVTDRNPQSLPPSLFEVHTTTVLGAQVTNIQLLIVGLALALTLALAWVVHSTNAGRAMRAFAFDPATARLLGVSPERLSIATMFASGAMAAGAGVLLAINLNLVSAYMGDGLLLKAFAIIILAGVGSIGGALVAAFLLAFVEIGVVEYVSSDLKDAVAFALIIVLLLLRPQGLFSRGAWQRA